MRKRKLGYFTSTLYVNDNWAKPRSVKITVRPHCDISRHY